MYAVVRGHITIVQLLLEAGANPNLKNNAGQTARDLVRKIKDESAQEKILTLLDESNGLMNK